MEQFDYNFCEFVEKEMWFLTYIDFVANRKVLKAMFDELPRPQKRMYMWYVYANIHMNETYKNRIWDYLNGYLPDAELIYYARFYKTR